MNIKKYKWQFYIFTFFLVSVVALVLKEITPGKSIPAVSEAILIVGLTYTFMFLLYKLSKSLFGKGSIKNNKDIDILEPRGRSLSTMNFQRILVITIIVLVLCGSFYWFLLRPSDIRKHCAEITKERARTSGNSDIDFANNVYRVCLVENGIAPESLLVK